MSKDREMTIFGTVTQAEIDRAIRRAHRLRSEETRRMLRGVGKRVRAAFHH